MEPEATIDTPGVDMICIGEGESAVTELVYKLENREDVTGVRNIWVNNNGVIYRNPVRPLIQDLDSLQEADREIYAHRYSSDTKVANFLTSRGCPFSCSYCQNKYLRELYRGKGRFVRHRNIELLIDEIKSVTSRYDCKRVVFSDEMLTLNKRRALQFCEIYKKEVRLPFFCQTRPTHVDEEILGALKEAGCERINMAVEAGNDYQRNTILKRNTSTETIISAFAMAHKIGLKTGSFNMIGIPQETEATVYDTININRKLKPNLIMCNIYMPFKGTEIGELFETEGWIKEDPKNKPNYRRHITTELPTIKASQLIAYQMLFNLYVQLPKGFYPWINIFRRCLEKMPTWNLKSVDWLQKLACRRLIAFIENQLQRKMQDIPTKSDLS